LWMISGSSLYSSAEIQIFLKEVSDARIEPPIQAEYFLSGGAKILIFVSFGASFFTSFKILSP